MQKVLIIGVPGDRVLSAFTSFLLKNNCQICFANLDLLGTSLFFLEDMLILGKQKFFYEEFSGVYNRIVTIDDKIPSELTQIYFQQLEIINILLEIKLSNVINKPSAASSNNSKPYQLNAAKKMGFSIPESLMLANTQCPPLTQHVIYKSVGGTRSIVSLIKEELHHQEIANPVLFQQYIVGDNIRVHVIDDEVFALKITSEEVDYRYTESPNKYKVIRLPQALQEHCLMLTKYLNLRFTGIDIIESKDKEYYFLEANTSPAFTHFEEYMPEKNISKALMNALLGNSICF